MSYLLSHLCQGSSLWINCNSFNSACLCCARREQVSWAAVMLGALSLSCLITALMTDHWVHTNESVGTRSSYGLDQSEFGRIGFDIGLWKVCPSRRQINRIGRKIYLVV